MAEKNVLKSFSGLSILSVIVLTVSAIILISIFSSIIPELNTAGDELNATGAPLGGLFVANGVVTLIAMTILVFIIIFGFLKVIGKLSNKEG